MKTRAAASLFILLMACTNRTDQVKILKARIAPPIHVRVTDSSLKIIQDTVFWKGNLFSGVLYNLSEKGDTLLNTFFIDGVQEGVCKKWYTNGQLEEERLYIKGMKNGLHRGWWPNGNPRFEFTIYEDRYEGERKEWNEEGLLIMKFHYKNGHESGRQQCWYNDGNVKANYSIINGRRYGLLGTKNCTNVSDSLYTP